MGITMTTSLDHQIEELIREFLNQPMSEAIKQGQISQAYRRGLGKGITALLMLKRHDTLKHFPQGVPIVFDSEVLKTLQEQIKPYFHGTPAEKKEIIEKLCTQLSEYAVSEDLVEQDEAYRREMVLAGVEQAKATDTGWLAEAVAAKKKEMEDLMDLLKPVGDKVNRAPLEKRAVKDQPQA
jgi:hypothetical protein